MRTALPWLLAIGCRFSPGTGEATDPDAPPDVPGGCQTFSSQLDTCAITQFGSGLTITVDSTYDTSTGMLVQAGVVSQPLHVVIARPSGMVDVVLVDSFTLASGIKLRVTGSRAFGIVAPGAITIGGLLDLVGPAAGSRTDAICMTSAGTKGTNDNQGAGGGGGGGFQGTGGTGGTGDLDQGTAPGGPGGTLIALPTGPVGGCDGGAGGDGNGTQGGSGGDGGGALLLASGASITISGAGVINVGGSGGRPGGQINDGGGGGGSGGMMLLESGVVVVTGVLAANGGGGGEGEVGNFGQPGQGSAIAALGGAGGAAAGGDGANGGAGGSINGITATDLRNGGGGGGGGAAGYIAIACPSSMTAGGTISPAFSAWP